MSILDRLLPDFPEDQRSERTRLLGLMGMFFLVLTAVHVLKPVKNALALSALGEDFYQVYLVSAVVVLFVPLYNRLADRVGWRTLVPAVALFFAANLVLFRLAYEGAGPALGLVFYGWYDLFAAALVTQFFVATQMFLNARSAKGAYPLVIGGGAVGAVLGGAIAAFLADRIGTANLLLVAGGFILLFGIGIGFVWPREGLADLQRARQRDLLERKPKVTRGELSRVFGNSHVRLIAASVLLAILVKQLVDYQYNTLTERRFVTEDAITEFQGMVAMYTQWLPLVAVVALRPLLRRWGVTVAVFLLPVLMMLTGVGLVAAFGLWTVIAVRTADNTFRYSAERAGREILYVPVPGEIKLKAKTYIDVGIEKGLGKALSAGFLFLLIEALGLTLAQTAWVALALIVGWLALTVMIRREYVRTLAGSIRGRFASFEGLSALSDASTQKVVRRALEGRDPVQTSFALDLVDQSAGTDTRPIADGLHDLLEHDSQDIRRKALLILMKDPPSIDTERVRARLLDPARAVREQAVLALMAARPDRKEALASEFLASERTEVRTATLACLARGDIEAVGGELLREDYIDERRHRADAGDRDARIELALAVGALRADPRARELIEPLLGDPDPMVASAAIRSAGMLRHPELHPSLIWGLRAPGTREAAREALAEQGSGAVASLAAYLLNERGHPMIRRQIPSVLARMPEQEAVDAMLHSVVAPETDQILDYRTLKALNKLRVSRPELVFDREPVMEAVTREVRAAVRYDRARRALRRLPSAVPAGSAGAAGRTGGDAERAQAGERVTPAAALLSRSLEEAWAERQEGVFRLIGLLLAPQQVYRAYLAVCGRDSTARANALEWLEETLGRPLFEQLAPVLGEGRAPKSRPALNEALPPLLSDGDRWIARLAIATAAEAAEPWSRQALSGIIESGTPELRELARRLLEGHEPETPLPPRPMDLIEKVFLLQKIDLLQDARSAHLALLASIAEEVEVGAGTVLIRQHEPTEALYVVVDGVVALNGVNDQRLEARDGQAFGTWALIDEAPSLVTATATARSRLLRITRNEFYDLLADHSELALGLLQGLARRVRTLVA